MSNITSDPAAGHSGGFTGKVMARHTGFFPRVVAHLLIALWIPSLHAQQLEPRRWGHLPVGTQFISAAYLYTDGEIFFDPTLRIEDAEMGINTLNMRYLYSFDLAGRSARVEVDIPYQDGSWQGIVDGKPTSVSRTGITDPRLRWSVLLSGAPALSGNEFADYQRTHITNTIIGAGLSITLPSGEYFRDRLINLGGNRLVVRPEAGVLHTRGKRSWELTGSVSVFEENKEFFPGNGSRKQDPLFLVQGHTTYTFPNRMWGGVGIGYGFGGESSIEGVEKDDQHDNYYWALSLGIPLSTNQRVKLTYAGAHTNNLVGTDSQNFLAAWSLLF
mgnify:CR=1 FL=1